MFHEQTSARNKFQEQKSACKKLREEYQFYKEKQVYAQVSRREETTCN